MGKTANTKRKNETTFTYQPTFKVRLTTTRRRKSTRIKECEEFPRKTPRVIQNLGAQYTIPEEFSAPIKKSRPYKSRKTREVESWHRIRQTLLHSAVEAKVPTSKICSLCNAQDAFYRCHDCCPLPLCYPCVLTSHALQPLHIIEKLLPEHDIYWPIKVKALNKLRVPGLIPVGSEREKDINLIDSKGRTHHKCTITYSAGPGMGDEMFLSALVQLGFWPTSPSVPTTAVSLELLSMLHCLTLECQTSAQGFVSAVTKTAYNPQKENYMRMWDDAEYKLVVKTMPARARRVTSKLYKILRGECLPEFRLYWQSLNRGAVSLVENFNLLQKTCPACPKAPDEGPLIVSFDGNFGLVHKSNSGVTYSNQSPLSDLYFLDQKNVDVFVDSYYQDSKDTTQQCSQFQAGNVVRSKNKAAKLNVTGVFGSTCKHEIPHRFMDLRHGERLSYPVMLLKEIKSQLPENVSLKLLYDIACTFKTHLLKRKNDAILEGVTLAIPVFHSYGHKGDCQITMNPRRMSGFGLSDGEQVERLWSYLRLFSKITKEQTPGHRKELLAMALLNYAQKKIDTIENQLVDRYRRAEETMLAAGRLVDNELKEMSELVSVGNEEDFLLKLKADEDEYHTFLHKKPQNPTGTWKQAYAKELLQFNTLNAQLHSGLVHAEDTEKVLQTTRAIQLSSTKLLGYEKQYKLKRWLPTSQEYLEQLGLIEDERKAGLLVRLHALLVEKQFYFEVRKDHSAGGQAAANRVTERVKKVTQGISTVIKGYNAGSSDGLPTKLPAVLRTGDVSLDNDIFNGMHPPAKAGEIPYSIRRRILDKSALKKRCKEEMEIIHLEMKNTYRHFCELNDRLVQFLTQIDCTSTYGRGLHGIVLLSIIELEVRLSFMWKKIKLYVGIPPPPAGYSHYRQTMMDERDVSVENGHGKPDYPEPYATEESEEEEEEEEEGREEEEEEEEEGEGEEEEWTDIEIIMGRMNIA